MTSIMDVNEFKERVLKGQQLVILDDLVLDVTKFMPNHPGGKFLLQANIGRDISKYFYGGYQMENYSPVSTLHNHTNIARYVVNTLAIARLERHVPRFTA